MSNENNNGNKDISNTLSKYSDLGNKGTNIILDSANQINQWYADQINKISEGEVPSTRLETNVDNTEESNEMEIHNVSKIETKVEEYNELQTNNKSGISNIKHTSRINTQNKDNDINTELDSNILENNEEISEHEKSPTNTTRISKMPKRISTAIKGVKVVNNAANKIVKTGKTINTSINEGGLKSFENSSSRIMTKPIKKAANKVTNKATNIVAKGTKKVVKKVGTKVVQKTTHLMIKLMQLIVKLIASVMKLILSMLPEIAPVIIILVVIVAFCSFFRIRHE